MTLSVYGHQCEFENRNGRYMILSGNPPIRRTELDKLDDNMLRNAEIPRLLSLEAEETDTEIRFRYRLPAARSVRQFRETDDVTFREALQLLISVAEVLDDCRTYMLRESRYVLHPDCVFVGRGPSEVWLAYLPIAEPEAKPSVRQELYQLALLLLERPGTGAPPGQRVLFDCLKSSLFQITEFRKLAVSLLLETGPLTNGASIPSQTTHAYTAATGPETERKDMCHAVSPAVERRDLPIIRRWKGGLSAASGTLVWTLCLLLAALWGTAAWNPSEGMILLSAGVTMLAGQALYLRAKKITRGSADLPLEAPEPALSVTPVASGISPPETGDEPVQERTFPWQVTESRLYALMPAQTVLLKPSDETVLLAPQHIRDACLETERDGQTVQIPLTGDRFVVGRKDGEADLVDDSPEVSRLHGEILRSRSGWSYRDMGSKNGSFRNGERMPPGEEIPLEEGDILTIARTNYTFRTSGRP